MSSLYFQASKVLELMDPPNNFGFRVALYSVKINENSIRKVGAVVHSVIRNRILLNKIFLFIKKKFKRPIFKNELYSLSMLADLLFMSRIQGGGQVRQLLMQYYDDLKLVFHKDLLHASKGCLEMPQYIRVANCSTTEKVIARLFNEFKLSKEDVSKDDVLPRVLKICEQKRLHNENPIIREGHAVIQDRSSCLAAIAAQIKPGTTVCDACASPGSKTLHAIDMLNGKGQLIAVERNLNRAAVLIHRLVRTGSFDGPYQHAVSDILIDISFSKHPDWYNRVRAHFSRQRTVEVNKIQKKESYIFFQKNGKVIVEVRIMNFLNMADDGVIPLREIECILLDPSCSGTGLPLHSSNDGRTSKSRLVSLSAFQKHLLLHALVGFPSAACVCYTTCSVMAEENDEVVDAVLKTQKHDWKVEVPNRIPIIKKWITDKKDRFVRAIPEVHKCRGFFLAKFVRKSPRNVKAVIKKRQKRRMTATRILNARRR
eukprot:GHVL01044158.1.p1 GENE.GHVL01044158.1~~GHVL01044158.1.p1  ORF type:complete len:485 (+),score=62.23 GHVL01044158.1:49-1503(+)